MLSAIDRQPEARDPQLCGHKRLCSTGCSNHFMKPNDFPIFGRGFDITAAGAAIIFHYSQFQVLPYFASAAVQVFDD
jgi:hypothetical protein